MTLIEYRENGDIEENLEAIAAAMKSRWKLKSVPLVRRSGVVEMGKIISLVGVSFPNSVDAFDTPLPARFPAKSSFLSVMRIVNRPAFMIALLLMIVHAPAAGAADTKPVNVILDTDMFSDVDDVGALATLHGLANRGEANILGVAVNTKHTYTAPCIDAINTYYGRPDIPVGVPRDFVAKPNLERAMKGYPYQIAKEFPHDLLQPGDAENAVDMFRRLLAQAPNESVTIVSVGKLNNLASLLDSPADAHSLLTGPELVAQKVRLLSVMGGYYSGETKGEHNFTGDKASTKRVVNDWPSPVMYSGWEIGAGMGTGAALANTPAHNPVRRAYEVYFGGTVKNRSSWDQVAVLYAVRGLGSYWDAQTVGSNTFDASTGINTWVLNPDPTGREEEAYLIGKMDRRMIAGVIDELMAAPPIP